MSFVAICYDVVPIKRVREDKINRVGGILTLIIVILLLLLLTLTLKREPQQEWADTELSPMVSFCLVVALWDSFLLKPHPSINNQHNDSIFCISASSLVDYVGDGMKALILFLFILLD